MIIYLNKTEFDGTNLDISDAFSPMRLRVYSFSSNLRVEIIKPGFDPKFEPQNENINLLDFDNAVYNTDHYNGNPVEEFLKCIPHNIKTRVKKFKYQQLQLIQVLSFIDWEDAMSDENLILIWLLICKSIQKNWNRTRQLDFLSKGFEFVFDELYDPNYLSTADLKKINGNDIGEPEFNGIDFLIETGKGAMIFKRQKEIPAKLLRLMFKYPDMTESNLLQNIFKSKRDYLDVIAEIDPLSGVWAECLSIGIILKNDYLRTLNKITNISDLYWTRDHWYAKMEGLQEFPEPPIDGSLNIVPVQTPSKLFSLIRHNHHLVPAYFNAVYEGRCYFYTATMPEDSLSEDSVVRVKIKQEGFRLARVWSKKTKRSKTDIRKYIENWFAKETKKLST
jgi:hypothetical protein